MFRAFLACICLLGLAAAAAGSPAQPETEAAKKARMEWWTEARLGMFIHWGLYALPAR
ncbi:MAG: alpha-L-fucosidase, partial [Candidatus Aminicenantales bacterium]